MKFHKKVPFYNVIRYIMYTINYTINMYHTLIVNNIVNINTILKVLLTHL